jgi:hypothetical protein
MHLTHITGQKNYKEPKCMMRVFTLATRWAKLAAQVICVGGLGKDDLIDRFKKKNYDPRDNCSRSCQQLKVVP